MKLIHLPLVVMGIGVLLVVLSFLWPRIMGTSVVWSEDQAHELSEASAEMHRLVHEHHHGSSGGTASAPQHGPTAVQAGENHGEEEPEVLRVARERYQRSEGALQGARSLQQGPTKYFKWSGILCALLGVLGYYVLRQLGSGL